MIIQQPGAVQVLPGVVAIGLADPARAPRAPRPEVLRGALAAGGRRQADTAEMIAVQVGHRVRAAVAQRHDGAVERIVALDRAANQLFPQPAQVDCADAAAHLLDPLAIRVVGGWRGRSACSYLSASAVRLSFACAAGGKGRPRPLHPRPGACAPWNPDLM